MSINGFAQNFYTNNSWSIPERAGYYQTNSNGQTEIYRKIEWGIPEKVGVIDP